MSEQQILLVDDDPYILSGLSKLLSAQDFHVITAETGRKALGLLRDKPFTIVITDLILPDLDGIDILKYAKENHPETAVIILTGRGNLSSAIEAIRLRADDYIQKPCASEELFFRINQCLEKKRLQKRINSAERNLRASLDLTKLLLDASNDAIIITDSDAVILNCNQIASQELRRSKEALIGFNLFQLNSEVEASNYQQRFLEVVKTSKFQRFDLVHHDQWRELTLLPLSDGDDLVTKVIIFSRDITEKKLSDKRLQESEERFRNIFRNASVSLLEADLSDLRVRMDLLKRGGVANFQQYLEERPQEQAAWIKMIRITDANLASLKLLEAGGKPDLLAEGALSIISEASDFIIQAVVALDHDKEFMECEISAKTLGGKPVHLLVRLSLPSIKSRYKHMLISLVDITERKHSEEGIKKSLAEKTVLLREVHHRVKNNLSMVVSLINLQSSKIKDDHYQEHFAALKNRIHSISLLHERLYKSRDLAQIDFSRYTRELLTNLMQSLSSGPLNVKVDFDMEDISLDIDIAIPLGLIITELSTNALKYGFKQVAPLEGEKNITIALKLENGYYLLTVFNSGDPLPESIQIQHTDSLGLRLVNVLTKQLGGTLRVSRHQGTQFAIRFPIPR